MTAAHPTPGLLAVAQHCAALGAKQSAVAGQLLDRAALHVLDWLGCAVQGCSSEQGQVFQRWLQTQAGGALPTLAGRSTDSATAAAFHGALGSALEMDDVHRSSVLHPGPVVIPAALAATGGVSTTSGAALLSAVIAGYEAMIRVGQSLGPVHYRHWHPTSTAGTVGAAAAAASVMGLGVATTAHAMALAATRAGGLWQLRHEATLAKSWHTAGAARDGVAAAQLAACGLSGPLAVIEGPSGWLAATAPGADAGPLWEPRSQPWLLDVSFKPWPACRHAHPAMDALQEALALATAAQQGQPLRAEQLECIDVFTYADALRFCDHLHPQVEAQARFSLQHALAAWVQWGPAQLKHYQAHTLTEPAVKAMRERVHLHTDPAIEARYPQQYGARVVLHWRANAGAAPRRTQAQLADTRGDPARPLSTKALQDKARALMAAGGWSPARSEAALLACAALPQAQDLCALRRAILGP